MNKVILILLLCVSVSEAQNYRRAGRWAPVASGPAASVYRDTVDADNRDGASDSSSVGVLDEKLYMQTSPTKASAVSRYDGGGAEGHEEYGMEFQINLAKSTTIDSAFVYIQLTSDRAASYGTNDSTDIGVYDVDNASVYNDAHAHNMNNHETASSLRVKWNVPASTDTYLKSPNIASLIQVPINRAGWSSGNYIGLFLRYSASWDAYTATTYYVVYDNTASRLAYIEVWTH
jgi:hypothetical protein